MAIRSGRAAAASHDGTVRATESDAGGFTLEVTDVETAELGEQQPLIQ